MGDTSYPGNGEVAYSDEEIEFSRYDNSPKSQNAETSLIQTLPIPVVVPEKSVLPQFCPVSFPQGRARF